MNANFKILKILVTQDPRFTDNTGHDDNTTCFRCGESCWQASKCVLLAEKHLIYGFNMYDKFEYSKVNCMFLVLGSFCPQVDPITVAFALGFVAGSNRAESAKGRCFI